jgi:CYTH domain-containing protein
MTKPSKYAHPEHERRFLLAELPKDVDPALGFDALEDLYLEGTRLRLRRVRSPTGEALAHKLTQKLPDPSGDPARRLLTTLYLDAAEYARLAHLPGRRLAKRRHRHRHEGLEFAIDVFAEPLAGLVLAELELPSAAELAARAPPPFACCEVTALPLFTGASLAAADPARVLAEARRLLGRP